MDHQTSNIEAIFPGTSEMARYARALDWSCADAGAPSTWSLAVRQAVALALEACAPMAVLIGARHAVLYNDEAAQLLDGERPERRFARAASEWLALWRPLEGAVRDIHQRGGPARVVHDVVAPTGAAHAAELPFLRCSLSPLLGGDSRAAGVFMTMLESPTRRRAGAVAAAERASLRDLALAEQRARRRIASDLHDRIGQSLVAAEMKLAAIRHRTSGITRREVDAVMLLLEETIDDTRTLTFDISPPVLYDLGLGAALDWLGERTRERHDVGVVVLDHAPPARIDRELAAVVFRLVQELVMNVVKHADARVVRIQVEADERALRVTVTDHGRGFDVARVRDAHPGFGLFSVREQAARLGGALELESSPGAGTRATVIVPLREPESKAGAA